MRSTVNPGTRPVVIAEIFVLMVVCVALKNSASSRTVLPPFFGGSFEKSILAFKSAPSSERPGSRRTDTRRGDARNSARETYATRRT